MAKKGGGQPKVVTTVDEATKNMQQNMYAAATKFANAQLPGVSGSSRMAGDAYNHYMQAGQVGLDMMAGDPLAASRLMNPYQQAVVDGMHDQFDAIRKRTLNAVDDAATRSGAFGGSRHALTAGQALGDVARQESQLTGQLLFDGFTNAVNRGMQLANLGFGAANQLNEFGKYERGVDIEGMGHKYQVLRDAIMPLEVTKTESVQKGPLGASILGGASTGAGIAKLLGLAGPWGWAAAGIGGLLGGLFR